MFKMLVLMTAAALLFASPLHAKKKPVEDAVVSSTYEAFVPLVEKIRGEMATGERYEFLSNADRDTVNAILDEMSGMLEKSGSVAAMQPEERARMMTDQEKVNGILARNADDRLICTHVAPVGSHIPKTKCLTARQVAENRERYRKNAIDLQNGSLSGGGPGS
ncbi:hypothetical protein [Dokdonella sp.]|uniref:hypothetical protein n=1 Tax=Dokdonella sp. TaxID=2291710 RepID=UPI0035288938